MAKQLSEVRMKVLLRLLDFVNPLPNMQYAVIRKFWGRRLVPMNPMELILVTGDPFQVPPRNLRVLLLYRDDEYFSGWHFPGGLLGSDEKVIEGAVRRVAWEEVGVALGEVLTVRSVNFSMTARNHNYSTIHVCRMTEEPVLKQGIAMMAPLGALPENLITSHRDIADGVLAWLYEFGQLELGMRKRIIEVTSVIESSVR